MSTTSVLVESPISAKPRVKVGLRNSFLVKTADYLELSKPKIAVLELVVVAVAAVLTGWTPADGWSLMHVLLGTTLIAASASALNQFIERNVDCYMQRTCDRPLPAGRLTPREVLIFGVVTVALGGIYLALMVNFWATCWALIAWMLYVWVYTPLKSRTVANTCVGAIAGAMPVLIGAAVSGRPPNLTAATLFAIVFLWQFPHFMAIAWLYRNQYAQAGLKMLPVVDPTGKRAGAQAVLAALALVPVCLMPTVFHLASPVVAFATLGLTLWQLAAAVMFLFRLNDISARQLLRVSLIFLPSLLLLLLIMPYV